MRIRKTTERDFKRVTEIYARARQFMAEHGNPNQWGPTNWPHDSVIIDDIKNGNSYVCENDCGRIIGVFYYNYGEDPCYKVITDGRWIDDSPYGVVHRIASDGSQKGVGEFCLNWAYSRCGHLRIDTYSDNIVLQNLLRKLGFEFCGTVYVVEDKLPRMAFEKT